MTDNNSIWYFENVDLFNLLCPHKVSGMSESHVMNKFSKNEFIYFPDDVPHHIYMIAEGRIKIGSYTDDGKEIVKAILGPGELFGELALTGEDKRNDFAQAMDNKSIVCPMNVAEMKEMMSQNKPLSFKVMKLIGLRLRKIERRLESLVFKDARTRVVEFLKDQATEKGRKVGFETMIPNHLTHKDIASLTGTSRQTVTTILNDLRDKNLINFDRRKILIRDLEKIA